MVKLKDIIEDLELGKVYTDKDRPPFQVKEGQKRNSHNAYMKYYKAYEAFARETMDLGKTISKLSGDKTDEKIIIKNFKKYVVPFAGLMNSWDKGQQQNPGLSEQTINEAPEHQLASALNKVSDNIIKITKRFEKKADVDGMVRSWMLGLKSRLKKAGIK